jgi:hypothetical protein
MEYILYMLEIYVPMYFKHNIKYATAVVRKDAATNTMLLRKNTRHAGALYISVKAKAVQDDLKDQWAFAKLSTLRRTSGLTFRPAGALRAAVGTVTSVRAQVVVRPAATIVTVDVEGVNARISATGVGRWGGLGAVAAAHTPRIGEGILNIAAGQQGSCVGPPGAGAATVGVNRVSDTLRRFDRGPTVATGGVGAVPRAAARVRRD